ncbi:NAD(P)-dependent oxidoreductase [Winogradskya humida]|uniref:Oxidoreductase n=1 Tax=Winogradskya humida TaxID=113566 RepID=A0ABQ4A2G4_9ACTN|nr:NAD(P)-dependent oxidoreductase [Actinoplanes humidus]GIE24532.1 oxidoreductase [Actinoplanes humidus]
MTAVDWYGLGTFGLPMATRCITAGYPVRAGNGRGRLTEFRQAGGRDSTAEGAPAPIVALCLPSATEVLDVVRNLGPAAWVVDFSSHDPASAVRAAELLRERGIGYVDCPVSGSVDLARDGQLTGYVGATPEELPAEVREFVGTICAGLFWTGGLGQGQGMKLVNQVIHLGNVLVLGEGFQLAEQFGLAPATVLAALKASSGASRMLERFGEQMLSERYPRQFSARLAHKDIRNALRLAPDLPVAAMVEDRLRAVVEAGDGEQNFTRLARRPVIPPATG